MSKRNTSPAEPDWFGSPVTLNSRRRENIEMQEASYEDIKYYLENIPGVVVINMGSVKNVGVEDTPRISEPLSFFEKTLFLSAPTGVSHR